jgi:hypothetical protein
MKIKHRIIGEYVTKRCFFRFKKADHRYWNVINYAKSIFIYLYTRNPDATAWMLKFVVIYLANTAVLCYSLDNNFGNEKITILVGNMPINQLVCENYRACVYTLAQCHYLLLF